MKKRIFKQGMALMLAAALALPANVVPAEILDQQTETELPHIVLNQETPDEKVTDSDAKEKEEQTGTQTETKKKTEVISGFVSKTGMKFDAPLKLTEDGDIAFDFPEKPKPIETNVLCPKCGRPLKKTQWKYECECGFNVWHTVAKVEISEEILTELFTTGKTKKKVTGFTSKAGNVFDTCLKFENDQISFDFDNPGEEEVQSTAEVHNNADTQSNTDAHNNAEVQSTADDTPDETTLNEMGIPEEFLAGLDMAADSAQADDVSEAALAAAHELFGE